MSDATGVPGWGPTLRLCGMHNNHLATGADDVFLSLLQESPSLWHFMTTRRGQKTTSASGKEKGSRLSTARKSLQLLNKLSALGRNVSFYLSLS